jgi:hypothetical protein
MKPTISRDDQRLLRKTGVYTHDPVVSDDGDFSPVIVQGFPARQAIPFVRAAQAELSPLMRLGRQLSSITVKQQMGNRQLDSVSSEHGPRWGRSALELWSGKVPLRPIHRIGLLLLNGPPLLFLIFFGPRAISALKGAPTAVLCLLLPLILLWTLIAFATGRWVWAALTAPSQRDKEPPKPES